MPLIIDGVTLEDGAPLLVGGVQAKNVMCNGVEVWTNAIGLPFVMTTGIHRESTHDAGYDIASVGELHGSINPSDFSPYLGLHLAKLSTSVFYPDPPAGIALAWISGEFIPEGVDVRVRANGLTIYFYNMVSTNDSIYYDADTNPDVDLMAALLYNNNVEGLVIDFMMEVVPTVSV